MMHEHTGHNSLEQVIEAYIRKFSLAELQEQWNEAKAVSGVIRILAESQVTRSRIATCEELEAQYNKDLADHARSNIAAAKTSGAIVFVAEQNSKVLCVSVMLD
jgi:ribosome biogenesis protein Nip4